MSSTVYDWGSMTEPTEPELPRAVALAWGVAANPQRGPKRELRSSASSMSRSSSPTPAGSRRSRCRASRRALGFTPMSLYRYVTAKDDLLCSCRSAGIGVPPESINEVEAAGAPGLRALGAARRCGCTRSTRGCSTSRSRAPRRRPTTSPGSTAALQVLDGPAARLRGQGLDRARDHGAGALARASSCAATSRWRSRRDDARRVRPARGRRCSSELVTPEQFPFVYAGARRGRVLTESAGGDPFASGSSACSTASRRSSRPRRRPPTPASAPDPLDAEAARDQKYKEAVKARREAEKALREARKRERERLREARDTGARSERR